MKKTLLSFLAMLLFMADSYSQASFTTGALEVSVNQYGRVRLFTPDGTRHLQRASILVGTTSTTVFDYTNDAEEFEPTVLVANPVSSDFEIYGAVNNAYSGLPPDVIAKYNAYGWNNGAYTIVKFNVTNNEANEIQASIGMDIIPEIGELYGYDTVSYNAELGVIRFHRGAGVNMGIKLLSAQLSSLYSFEWFDGYSADTSLWDWMNYGSLQAQYVSTTADGPVAITSQSPVSLANGQSVNVYYALAIGADEQTMLTNISSAVVKYQSMITSVDDKVLAANKFQLGQNQPNPFTQSTSISYQLPADGFVSLKVYNVIGNEVAELVSSNQTKGSYTVPFTATGLTTGMYYYTLRFGDKVQSNKMLLVK